MKILLDMGVGKAVADWLIEAGHEVLDAAIDHQTTADLDLLAIANADGRLVITMDKDFGELAYQRGLPHLGILLLRLEDADGPTKSKVVAKIFEKHESELPGNFAVYQKGKLRIRTHSGRGEEHERRSRKPRKPR